MVYDPTSRHNSNWDKFMAEPFGSRVIIIVTFVFVPLIALFAIVAQLARAWVWIRWAFWGH